MEILLIVIILLVATPYVVAPLRVHQRQRQNPRPTLEPFDTGKHLVTPQLINAMRQSVASLGAAGFTTLADLFRADQSTRMRVILMDTAAEDLALVLGATPILKPERGVASVELVARFEGERSLSVSNAPIAGVFASVPGREKVRLQQVRDPVRLYRIYQALVAHQYGAARRAPPDYRGDPSGFLGASMVRELRQQVDTGYLRLDGAEDAYRPTWKGAFLMCWKLLQPFRDIRQWLADRRVRTLFRASGLDELELRAGPAPARQGSGHWGWITIVAGIVILVVHPRFLDRGSSLGRSNTARVQLAEHFAVPADFPGAVKVLEGLAGVGSTPLFVQDSLGHVVRTDGVVLPAETKLAEALLAAVQDSFLARGFYLFRLVQEFGAGGHPDTLALYPARDGYAIVRLVGTNGANYNIGPDSVIAWLKALDRDQPFVLTGVGFDWVEGRFTTSLADPDGLAQRFNAFCPDVVTQGTGTVASLARELKRSGALYCWWD